MRLLTTMVCIFISGLAFAMPAGGLDKKHIGLLFDVMKTTPSTQLTEVFYHLGEIIQETINEMLMIQSSNLSMVGQNAIMEDIQNKIEKTVQDTPKRGRKKKVN